MKKITILTIGLLGTNFLFSQKFQGFEKSGSDNWQFTTNYARYNYISLTDQWADTSEIGTTSGSDLKITARTGTKLWGMRDLNNPVTALSPRHYMDFEAVANRDLKPDLKKMPDGDMVHPVQVVSNNSGPGSSFAGWYGSPRKDESGSSKAATPL